MSDYDDEDKMAEALSEIRDDRTYVLQTENRQLKDTLAHIKLAVKAMQADEDDLRQALNLERAKNKVLKLELKKARNELRSVQHER
jgi:hypothetical protein